MGQLPILGSVMACFTDKVPVPCFFSFTGTCPVQTCSMNPLPILVGSVSRVIGPYLRTKPLDSVNRSMHM
jgi:hypothetical protein